MSGGGLFDRAVEVLDRGGPPAAAVPKALAAPAISGVQTFTSATGKWAKAQAEVTRLRLAVESLARQVGRVYARSMDYADPTPSQLADLERRYVRLGRLIAAARHHGEVAPTDNDVEEEA